MLPFMPRSFRIAHGGVVYHVVNRANGYFTAGGGKAKEIAGDYWRGKRKRKRGGEGRGGEKR